MVIAVVATIPLVMLGVLTYESLEDSDRQRAEARSVAAMSDDVVSLINLQSDMTIEQFWAGAVAAVRTSGLGSGIASALLGFDVDQIYRESIDRVELRLGAHLHRPYIGDVIELIGEGRSLTQDGGYTGQVVSAPYFSAATLISQDITAHLIELDEASTQLVNDPGVLRAVDDLATAADLRNQMADTASHFFALRFPDQRMLDDVGFRLTAALIRHDDAAERFVETVEGGAEIHRKVHMDPDVAEFLAEAHLLVDEITDLDDGEPMLATDLITEFDLFQKSIRAIDLHVDIVDETAAALEEQTQAIVDQTNVDRNRAMTRAAMYLVGATVFVLITMRWIVRPLRAIAEHASRLLDGDFDHSAPAGGLRELRDAQAALDQAADHIQGAEQQALALAEADLDAELLSAPARGPLDEALHSAFARLRASIAEGEEYRQRLSYEASHDPLTGLPNRTSTLDRLGRAIEDANEAGGQVAVLFIDIDKFKRINDQQGHAAGDRVLRAVARRLVRAVRPSDHVGRLAGDEFVVVSDTINSTEHAVEIAVRIREVVSEPLEVGSAWLSPKVSIGIGLSTGDSGPDETLRDADLAVYRAKTPGSSGVELCDTDLRDELFYRIAVERRLLAALESDALDLHYQPILDVDTGRVTTYEALLRWEGPGGMEADDFIPIAERSDLIIDVDRWVIERVVGQLGAWIGEPRFAGVSVAVNLSARHLGAADVATTVLDTLEVHGVDPERLTIEITESALLDDVGHAVDELVRLREHGVRIAIDDFGTGHTSLSHLRELPIDVLKLDREFVRSAAAGRDRPLAKLIVDAGHLVGAVVVAEGVETIEQHDVIRGLGVDEVQGFLFGRPLPPDRIEHPVAATTATATTAIAAAPAHS